MSGSRATNGNLSRQSFIRRLYYGRKDAGLCVHCGKEAVHPFVSCTECLEKDRNRPRKKKIELSRWNRKQICEEIIYPRAKKDPESIFRDVKFIKGYLGFTCPKIEKNEIPTKTADNK